MPLTTHKKEKKEPLKDKVCYISKFENFVLGIKSSHRYWVDGREYFEPGKQLEFRKNRYETTDPEEVEILDELLSGRRSRYYLKFFHKVPSQRTIERIGKLAEEFREKEREALESEDVSESDRIAMERFRKFKERFSEKKTNAVEGMRGLHNTE